MTMSFCVLGSGSAGNCTLVSISDAPAPRFVLIDSGLSPRRTGRLLEPLGVGLEEISAIVLTHLDRDHYFLGWRKPVQRLGIPVHVHDRHRGAALRAGLSPRNLAVFNGPFAIEDTRFDPMLLAHDRLGTVGYVVEHAGRRLGFATDLGRVTDGFHDHFTDLDALAIESNYDRQMQVASPRPAMLKRRIMGGAGHLSNDQALSAVLRIDDRCALAHVVLLHLSRQCNDPRLVKSMYARRGGDILDRLTLTSQTRPTPMLHLEGAVRRTARPGRQLVMFD